jgi:hypothetical protein
MHQDAALVTAAAARVLPHGCEESEVTVNPLLAVIVPSVVAALDVFMIPTCCVDVAVPIGALSNVVTPG